MLRDVKVMISEEKVDLRIKELAEWNSAQPIML